MTTTTVSSLSLYSSEESNLAFLRSEYEATLKGLRDELQLVQQQCASLQLEAATRADEQNELESLRLKTATMESETASQQSQLTSLQTQLTSALESSEHYRWKTTELQHQLESREAKIANLQAKLAKQNEVKKLQSECERLYALQRSEALQTIRRVSQRARSPHLEHTVGKSEQELDDNDLQGRFEHNAGLSSLVVVEEKLKNDENKLGVRAKVFRHLLARSTRPHDDNDVRQLSLPHDYRSNVSTLPHIHRDTRRGERQSTSISQDS